MPKKKSLIFLIFFLFFVSPLPCSAVVFEQEVIVNRIDLPASLSTTVSGHVGGYIFDIEGLTSPWAQVEFSSTQGNVNLVAIADNEGVFRFHNALVPRQTGDFCFTSIDTHQRSSSPLCFSPPAHNTKTVIRGIILPPTISLEKDVFRQGESNAAEGATTPDSPTKVYLFEEERISFWELLDVALPISHFFLSPKFQIFAREGPSLTVNTNDKGEFSFNLPTHKSTVWKLFVGTQKTQLGENPSPKSNIIQFAALSWWQWFLLKIFIALAKALNLIKNLFLNPIFIITTLSFAIGLLIYLLKKRGKLSGSYRGLRHWDPDNVR